MTIWVDADACPVVIRDILFRAAARTGRSLILVANTRLKIPDSPNISFLLVEAGFDVADSEIVKRSAAGDLVITADIPLAAQVIEKGCQTLNFRGELSTAENIRDRLAMRNFMETLRGSGAEFNSGPPPLGPRDRKAFADALDAWLARNPGQPGR